MSDQIIDLTEPVMPASSETVREARSAGGAAGHAAAELALAAVNHRLDRLVASGADGSERLYDSYHALGGNGHGTMLNNDIQTAPIRPVERKKQP